MKFVLHENVIISRTGTKGQITRIKQTIIHHNGDDIETYEYFVSKPTGISTWHKEDELQTYDTFSKEFELGFLDLLIDMNLLHTKDYGTIKELQNKKYKLI
ncbi:hypothetical protein WKH57_01665 [Niallia taxi]|uniref:hypothetical protein n=1 Tax=Niallia taxi TaxID=2499688 RepID=UPI0031713E87